MLMATSLHLPPSCHFLKDFCGHPLLFGCWFDFATYFLEFYVLFSLASDYIQIGIPIEILSVERDVPAIRLAL